jgi:hypothetical protein
MMQYFGSGRDVMAAMESRNVADDMLKKAWDLEWE